MEDFPLNKIIHSKYGWLCNVFEFDKINIGGLYIDYEQFTNMNVLPFNNCNFRFYRKTKKIIVSSGNKIDFEYCAISLNYSIWKCLLCKKICNSFESKCFCKTYSTCWTPIDGEIKGVDFNQDNNFLYHFDEDILSNLIL